MNETAKIKKHVQEAKKEKRGMGMKTKNKISNITVYVILTIISIIWIAPFVCLLLESLRVEELGKGPVGYLIPKEWGIDNYVKLFKTTKFPKWFLNTFLTGLAVAVIQTVMVLTMSYTLSRLRFKGRKLLMNVMLILGMFPGFLTLILLKKVLGDFDLIGANSMFGLILVYCASSGMGYYVSKGFFDTIPRSLDEAARIDGATRMQVFFKVTLPLAKPIVIYTVLTAFMAPWGDFMLAKFLANNASDGMNVAVGLQNMIGEDGNLATQYTMFCAAGIVVAIPITILFLLLQKYYVEGVTGGAVKG